MHAPKQLLQGTMARLQADWRGSRSLAYGLVVVLLASAVVAMYYLNHPQPEINPDTSSYLKVTQKILHGGQLVDSVRTPGYPLFVALVFLAAGEGNLLAVSIVQGVLFVLATLEVYFIALLVLRRSGIACVIGLLVVTNTYLLSYAKPVIVEGASIWVVASLGLAIVWCIQSLRVSTFWLVALFMLLALMTRPEWIFFPPPICASLLWVA
jgi:hypothetical protein